MSESQAVAGLRGGDAEGDSAYVLEDGVFMPREPVRHREDEYDERGFALLRQMQERHFWYLGRRRFLWSALRRHLGRLPARSPGPRAIDLGGGAGGWVSFLAERGGARFSELAFSDSSLRALQTASSLVPASVSRYQVDLLRLGWSNRWEVAFLLDVLEHIPDDGAALRQVFQALSPGGLAFITTPALQRFWSWNDVAAGHQRRYARAELERLGREAGFRVLDTRYFMFLLSPLLVLSRLAGQPDLSRLSKEELWALVERSHRVPASPVNAVLRALFSLETPLGHQVSFPWGTSVLAVMQKP
ncbi:MAG: class I SAM-dependent methyltransferase [Myxococcaceae bacterium]|nr:class I SAM-dependent methyltransferase [Myxococcaceae bacterium]